MTMPVTKSWVIYLSKYFWAGMCLQRINSTLYFTILNRGIFNILMNFWANYWQMCFSEPYVLRWCTDIFLCLNKYSSFFPNGIFVWLMHDLNQLFFWNWIQIKGNALLVVSQCLLWPVFFTLTENQRLSGYLGFSKQAPVCYS